MWKHGQGSSGGRRYCGYFTIESGARNSIDRDLHLASGMNMLELSLLIVGSDPYLRGIDKIEESLPRLDKLADLYLLARSVSVARCSDDGI